MYTFDKGVWKGGALPSSPPETVTDITAITNGFRYTNESNQNDDVTFEVNNTDLQNVKVEVKLNGTKVAEFPLYTVNNDIQINNSGSEWDLTDDQITILETNGDSQVINFPYRCTVVANADGSIDIKQNGVTIGTIPAPIPETVTTITDTITGHKIGTYTNEAGETFDLFVPTGGGGGSAVSITAPIANGHTIQTITIDGADTTIKESIVQLGAPTWDSVTGEAVFTLTDESGTVQTKTVTILPTFVNTDNQQLTGDTSGNIDLTLTPVDNNGTTNYTVKANLPLAAAPNALKIDTNGYFVVAPVDETTVVADNAGNVQMTVTNTATGVKVKGNIKLAAATPDGLSNGLQMNANEEFYADATESSMVRMSTAPGTQQAIANGAQTTKVIAQTAFQVGNTTLIVPKPALSAVVLKAGYDYEFSGYPSGEFGAAGNSMTFQFMTSTDLTGATAGINRQLVGTIKPVTSPSLFYHNANPTGIWSPTVDTLLWLSCINSVGANQLNMPASTGSTGISWFVKMVGKTY